MVGISQITKTTEITAEEIGQIIIPQRDEQQNSHNVKQQHEAANAPPDNTAEGVDAMNLSQRNSEAPQRDDLRAQENSRNSSRELDQLRPRSSLNTAAGGNNPLRISKLRMISSKLLDKSKYEEAVGILEELATLLNPQDFDTTLMLAECFLHLRKRNEAEKAIDNLRNILTSSTANADDVKAFATFLISNSAYIRAIILLGIASDMYKIRAKSSNELMNWIEPCIREISNVLNKKGSGRSINIRVDYGIKCMKEISNKIFTDEFEQQFHVKASEYKIYGKLLHNIGVAYQNRRNYAVARSYFTKAIEAKQYATDYENETKKKKSINKSKKTRAQCN
ncbi:uncharacterized protein LOC144422136 [Styela clava]